MKNKILILAGVVLIIAIISIVISVKYFGNDYWGTSWHWAIAILSGGFWIYAINKKNKIQS